MTIDVNSLWEGADPDLASVPSVNGAAAAGEAPWPEPDAIDALADVPQWSDTLLPERLRAWLADAGERAQCPPEFLAIGAMVALGSVIGRGCGIRPKRLDSWTVVPNVWGAAIGGPSTMKSPALREATHPLRVLTARAIEDREASDFDRVSLAAREHALKAELERAAKKKHDLAELREQYEELAGLRQTLDADRRYMVNDATVEKLGEILRDSPRGALQFRDELAGWLRNLDKQGREADRAFYLECWDGTNPYTCDRVGRGTIRIAAATVSVLGGIQPGKLAPYLASAAAGDTGDDGLMQRFQLAVFPDPSDGWKYVDRLPDVAARDRAMAIFTRLADATPAELGAEIDPHDRAEIPFLRFDDEAQEYFAWWVTDLLTHLRSGEEEGALEAHLSKYPSLMPSLALICHLADVGHGPVSLDSAHRAAAWCEFLEAHARRIYGSACSEATAGASRLLAKIRAGKLKDPFSPRDVAQHHWVGLKTSEATSAAIDVLKGHGWVRTREVSTGGRPTTAVRVHPSLRGGTP